MARLMAFPEFQRTDFGHVLVATRAAGLELLLQTLQAGHVLRAQLVEDARHHILQLCQREEEADSAVSANPVVNQPRAQGDALLVCDGPLMTYVLAAMLACTVGVRESQALG